MLIGAVFGCGIGLVTHSRDQGPEMLHAARAARPSPLIGCVETDRHPSDDVAVAPRLVPGAGGSDHDGGSSKPYGNVSMPLRKPMQHDDSSSSMRHQYGNRHIIEHRTGHSA